MSNHDSWREIPEAGPSRFGEIALWLFVINLGIVLGAGLFEGRIVIPDWIGTASDGTAHWNAAQARQDDTGRSFWAFVSTGPLTILTIANLVAGWRSGPGMRRWWFGAAAIAAVERLTTLGYFIPTMIGLMEATDSPEAVASAERWAALNNVRHLLVLAALVGALKAFASVFERRGARGRRGDLEAAGDSVRGAPG